MLVGTVPAPVLLSIYTSPTRDRVKREGERETPLVCLLCGAEPLEEADDRTYRIQPVPVALTRDRAVPGGLTGFGGIK